jgi:hypothetical protein
MNMQRMLALVVAGTGAALLLPAGVSPSARSATSARASLALLERPAGFTDRLPAAVAKLVDVQEVDTSTIRLGATSGSVQYFVAQGARGLCLIRVDDPVGPVFTTTCASTLIAGGVYLGTLDRAAGTMQIADIVPDDVASASVDGKTVPVANNLLVTGDIPLGAPVSVRGAAGVQRVPITVGPAPLPAQAGP